MYIVKNALKCIQRSKGRNLLIGFIVLVIAVSACLGLSIREAAESARSETLNLMSVTATISYDRQAMMESMAGGEGGFDRGAFMTQMGDTSGLSLEEYQTYASASSVKEFYYTMTTSINGSDSLEPVITSESENQSNNAMGGFGQMQGIQSTSSDFQVVGVERESALTAFIEGTATVSEGVIFDVSSDAMEVIISTELATYNDLSIGDIITLTNPNSSTETYDVTIVGIYTDSSANESSMQMMGSASSDPANTIYISASALQAILDTSASVSTTVIDESTGVESETTLTATLSGTYVFEDTDAYYQFEEEVRTLGLSDDYVVSSNDLTAYESSLTPLNTLSTMAGWFLVVSLIIGAIILVVLNIFNIRERKYEIGVLAAMGMKKSMVAFQFLVEIFCVTMVAVIIGIGIGGITSVPVTNALLESQIASQQTQADQIENNFGRGEMPSASNNTQAPSFGSDINSFFGVNSETAYITEISEAMNMTVVSQMLGIAFVLTLASATASMLFVMRYEPLKILANRD